MSADLDRLVALADDIGTGIAPSELRPALQRIAADYAKVIAERDEWEKRARAENGLLIERTAQRDEARAATDRGWIDAGELLAERDEALSLAANARKMVLLIEAFIYEPQRVTEAGLVAQIQRFMTNQDVEYDADREARQ